MKKPAKDPIREYRIDNEAIVDANGPEEQVMGWYSYLDDKIRFPFQARCIARRIVSPLREGEMIEVHRMAPEDVCSAEMLALLRWRGRVMAVPLSNSHPLTRTKKPPKPSATGIIGSREVTVSESLIGLAWRVSVSSVPAMWLLLLAIGRFQGEKARLARGQPDLWRHGVAMFHIRRRLHRVDLIIYVVVCRQRV